MPGVFDSRSNDIKIADDKYKVFLKVIKAEEDKGGKIIFECGFNVRQHNPVSTSKSGNLATIILFQVSFALTGFRVSTC